VNAPDTLTQLFFNAVDRFSSKQAAVRYKEGGSWKDITHQELARQVKVDLSHAPGAPGRVPPG
jgi:hypothetical protein